jgi:hypothetical protein
VKAVFVQGIRRYFAGRTGGGAFTTKCAAAASASTLIGKGLVFVKTNVHAFASHAHAQEVCSKSLPVCVPLTLFEGPPVFRKQCSTQISTTRCDHFRFAMLLDACRLQVKPSSLRSVKPFSSRGDQRTAYHVVHDCTQGIIGFVHLAACIYKIIFCCGTCI